jgi:Rrf2 family transcriptional regulator, cysteine metabolism repressor
VTLLSRKADYALLILSYLYQNKDGGTARAITEQFQLSHPFVANILKELCNKGFVNSRRGVKGGYTLARDASTVTLAELLESVEDGFRLTVCNTDENSDPADPGCEHAHTCTMKGPLGEVHRRLMAVLRAVTLAELFDPAVKPGLFGLTVLRPATTAGSCGSAASTVETSPA